MMLGAQLTPTEAAAHAQRVAFRRSIAAKAVPDPGINLRPGAVPVVVTAPAPKPAPVYHVPLEPWCYPAERRPTAFDIQGTVAQHFKVTRGDIMSQRRTAKVVMPRHIAMYLVKELTPSSFPAIGRMFGKSDHSVPFYAVKKIEELCVTDPDIAADVSAIRCKLMARIA